MELVSWGKIYLKLTFKLFKTILADRPRALRIEEIYIYIYILILVQVFGIFPHFYTF
jgi:hypothetical protein